MIGRIIDNRYKILEKIGIGGMASVYRAQDILLDRVVAIKILHTDFASDHEFVARFKHEAQTAAKLSHPNIVNIYDVGCDDGLHYIVMEYVQGITLKEYIEKAGHLTIDMSVKIAIEIAEALEQAHLNGLVHCDIKPHNILVTSAGRIKVADFGIAKAVNAESFTKDTSVLGSVHYFSPEQASGKKVDARTDLYSLGIVLYEMLTGVLPFQGETPVSVALKHVQDDFPPPSKYNPAIPSLLEGCIVKALSKNPDDRFQTATEMISELRLSQGFVSTKIPKIVKNDFTTQIVPRIQPKRKKETFSEKLLAVLSSRSQKSIIIGMAVIFLIAFLWAFFSYGNFWSTKEIEVPNLIGKQVELAKHILEREDLDVSVSEVASTEVPIGQIINQSPAAGNMVKARRTIHLTVSKGSGGILLVPDLKGLTLEEASEKLSAIGLSIGNILEGEDKNAALDTIISQTPASPKQVNKGDTIDVVVNRKPEHKTTLPDVTGQTLDQAMKTLQGLEFHSINIVGKDANKPDAQAKIAKQYPAAGTAAAISDKITLEVEYANPGPETTAASKRSGTIDITVPQGSAPQRVQIIIIDDNGKRVVYDNRQQGGDHISKSVSGVGKVRVQVYLDDTLVQDQFL